MRYETGCGRCVFFAVDHNGGLRGWAQVVVRFLAHRWSGQCRRMQAGSESRDVASSFPERTMSSYPSDWSYEQQQQREIAAVQARRAAMTPSPEETR